MQNGEDGMCEVNEDRTYANNPSQCVRAWQSVIAQLHKLKYMHEEFQSFLVNTGNINNYVELKQKRYENSAEELCACLNFQFSKLPEDTKIGEGEMLMLADKKHREPLYQRDDLKITLKLFLKDFWYESIRGAIQLTMSELQIDTIEQLIISFPSTGESSLSTTASLSANGIEPHRYQQRCDENGRTLETAIDREWLASVLHVWTQIDAEYVATRKVFSVGVADFDLAALRALCDGTKLKPCVDHFNIGSYCGLSSELHTFAHEHDIQLLTHNDPSPFPLTDVFHSFCCCDDSKTDDERENRRCSRFLPSWAARYTVWVRRRSLMAAKGYFVKFQTADALVKQA